MSDTAILKEYLVALGFRTDETQGKKFTKQLDGWDKQAKALSRGLIGVATAAQAMVAQFAYSMEKLYYSSKRTDSAVGSIQALAYGASRVGVEAGTMKGALESMARNIRSNPGLTGLLNSLGIKVTGRDKADVLTDLVTQLKKMPSYVGERYANLFGIDPDTLFMLQQGIDKFKEGQADRKRMAAEMGVDTEKAAEAAMEYANQWREVWERVGLVKDRIAIELLPTMSKMADETNKTLVAWTKIMSMEPSKFWDDMKWGLFKQEGVVLSEESKARLKTDDQQGYGGVELSPEAKARLGQGTLETSKNKGWLRSKYESAMRALGAKGYQPNVADEASVDAATGDMKTNNKTPEQITAEIRRRMNGGNSAPAAAPSAAPSAGRGQPEITEEQAALFARLEKQYGLSPGILSRVWTKESGRGRNLTGPMTRYGTAKGHFQFIDGTAAQYGLDKDGGRADRDNLPKSADAAARYLGDLKAKYGGDEQKAAAAYNWGPGNVDRYGLGRAPAETKDYIKSVAPGGGGTSAQINQTNHITVTGATEPRKTADAIKEEMNTVNADTIRNFKAKVT